MSFAYNQLGDYANQQKYLPSPLSSNGSNA